MSKINDVLKEFKDFLSLKLEEETPEVKLAQMPLADGTMIEADSFESGQAVFVVNEEGNVPLPVGEYPMEDGMILVVAEEGMIAEMKQPEEEVVEEEEMAQEFVTVEDFNTAINEIKSLLSKEVETHQEEVSKLSKEKEDLQKEIDETPDAKPIVHAPVEVKSNIKLNKTGRILKNLRK